MNLFLCFCIVGLLPRPEGICKLHREEKLLSVFDRDTGQFLGRFPAGQCYLGSNNPRK